MRRFTITVDEEIGKWIDEQIESKRFRNASHAFDYAVSELKRRDKGSKNLADWKSKHSTKVFR
jgi:Arc/MetJ-type ribon-helix-helix transcriptional regulator